MTGLTEFLLFVAIMWPVGNVLGWLSVQDIPNRPWNWRVLGGFVLYGRWIERGGTS